MAFNNLSTCRSHAMGITEIPWTAINDYAKRHRLKGKYYEDLNYIIREMDIEYCKWLDRKNGKP